MPNVGIAGRAAALVAVISLSATGQQAVSQLTLAAAPYPDRTIDLPVEPVREAPAPTLASTAAQNDFPQFDHLYRIAVDRGEVPAAFTELHRFWTWSLENPTGAFYGQDVYDRLAALYPGFAAYIDEYRLIDSRGRAFYPSSETRRFLLTQAVGEVIPHEPVIRTAETAKPVPVAVVVAHGIPSARRSVRAEAPPLRLPPVARTPEALPLEVEAPLPIARVIPISKPAPVEPEKQDHRLSKALLLTILGLVGVGVVTLLLQTPGEEESASRSPAA